MEPAEFTLTLKGNPAEVSRVLHACMSAFQDVEKEGREALEDLYRLNLGDRYIYPRGPYSSLRGTVTMKHVDATVLGY